MAKHRRGSLTWARAKVKESIKRGQLGPISIGSWTTGLRSDYDLKAGKYTTPQKFGVNSPNAWIPTEVWEGQLYKRGIGSRPVKIWDILDKSRSNSKKRSKKQASRSKRKNPGCSWSDLGPGCQITFNRPRHGRSVGRVIMRASKNLGWIVNVRGTAGKPTLVTKSQFISATKGARSNPPTPGDMRTAAAALVEKKATPQAAAAAGYGIDPNASTIVPGRPSSTAETQRLSPIVPTKGPLANPSKNWATLAQALGCSEAEAIDSYQDLRRHCSRHVADDRKQTKLARYEKILRTKKRQTNPQHTERQRVRKGADKVIRFLIRHPHAQLSVRFSDNSLRSVMSEPASIRQSVIQMLIDDDIIARSTNPRYQTSDGYGNQLYQTTRAFRESTVAKDLQARAAQAKKNPDYDIERIHIDLIRPGDVVYRNDRLMTVGKKDIKRNTGMGTTLFGDSYKLGNEPVLLVKMHSAKPGTKKNPSMVDLRAEYRAAERRWLKTPSLFNEIRLNAAADRLRSASSGKKKSKKKSKMERRPYQIKYRKRPGAKLQTIERYAIDLDGAMKSTYRVLQDEFGMGVIIESAKELTEKQEQRMCKGHKANPPRGTRWRMEDGQIVTSDQLKRKFFGKLPTPAQRRMLGITKVAPSRKKKNPKHTDEYRPDQVGFWDHIPAGNAVWLSVDRMGDMRVKFIYKKDRDTSVRRLKRLGYDAKAIKGHGKGSMKYWLRTSVTKVR